jgi:hypothetical protein
MLSQKKDSGKGKEGSANNMATLLQGILQDLTGSTAEDGTASASVDAVSAPFTSPDLPVSKVQGVRALKTSAWLCRIQTATEIFVSVLSTLPLQHLSAWLMKTQGDVCWLSKKAEERPLVNLVSLRFSPAVAAINEAIEMLKPHVILGAPYPVVLLDRPLSDIAVTEGGVQIR